MPNKLHSLLGLFHGSCDLENAIFRQDWKAVEGLCTAHPRLARNWSHQKGYFDGKYDTDLLPLHLAVTLNPPASTIESLIEAYPKAVTSKDGKFQRFPIHLACQHAASVEVLQVLLSYSTFCASGRDTLMRTPLHYALANGADPDKVELLLQSYPKGAMCADKSGWLPMHVACYQGAPVEVIEKLLKANPSSAYQKTKHFNTPVSFIKDNWSKESKQIISLLEQNGQHNCKVAKGA